MKANNLKRIFMIFALLLIIGTISVAKYTSIKKLPNTGNNLPKDTPVEQPIVDVPKKQEPEVNNVEPPIENEPIITAPVKEEVVINETIIEEVEEPIVVESVSDFNNEDVIIKSKYISKDKAIEIALKKMGKKAKLINIEAEFDDNPPIYKLEIKKNKFIYELEIHAKTGAILSSEKEKVY